MLAAFLVANRGAIIARTRASVTAKDSPTPSPGEPTTGIPAFLDQLGEALRLGTSSTAIARAHLASAARRHGQDLLRNGLMVAQVVRDYGEVCRAITDLATEQDAHISVEEFRTLSRCIDDATAEAVTAFALLRDRAVASERVEHLGMLAHELLNLLNVATLAFENIKTGRVAAQGRAGDLLDSSLLGIRNLIDAEQVGMGLEVAPTDPGSHGA
ncbi:MAG: hypothetical protein IAG13_03705 [Deltaproteobacteria bacterium]|nr:hypothetical protein [Nannocystaceae bacterium]